MESNELLNKILAIQGAFPAPDRVFLFDSTIDQFRSGLLAEGIVLLACEDGERHVIPAHVENMGWDLEVVEHAGKCVIGTGVAIRRYLRTQEIARSRGLIE